MAYLTASRLREILADARRGPDVALLCFGLRKGWISTHTVGDLLVAGQVRDSTDEVTVAVLLAMDEGDDAVQAVLEAASGRIKSDEELIRKAWWGILISDVLFHQDSDGDILTRIGALWADNGYPPEWESFIHYMPPEPDLPAGSPESVLERAVQCSKAWVALLENG